MWVPMVNANKCLISLLDTSKCAKARALLMTHTPFPFCIQTISTFNTVHEQLPDVPNVLREPSQSKTRTASAKNKCKKLAVMVTHIMGRVWLHCGVLYMLMSPAACGIYGCSKIVLKPVRIPSKLMLQSVRKFCICS